MARFHPPSKSAEADSSGTHWPLIRYTRTKSRETKRVLACFTRLSKSRYSQASWKKSRQLPIVRESSKLSTKFKSLKSKILWLPPPSNATSVTKPAQKKIVRISMSAHAGGRNAVPGRDYCQGEFSKHAHAKYRQLVLARVAARSCI